MILARTCSTALPLLLFVALSSGSDLQLNRQDVFETHGLSVLLFHNAYHGVFGDEKMSGLEIILHDQRIATNGDVRLSATPEQWDPIPSFKGRNRGPDDQLTAIAAYPDRGLAYRIEVVPEAGGFQVRVQLDQPLPAALNGKAGFNLEFLPSAYFEKSFIANQTPGVFPRHPQGPMREGQMEFWSLFRWRLVSVLCSHRKILSPA